METTNATVTIPYDEFQKMVDELAEARKRTLIDKDLYKKAIDSLRIVQDDNILKKRTIEYLKKELKQFNTK